MQSIDPSRGEANALSHPPGKYDRKIKTQRNRRELAQAVEHVVQFDSKRGTLPGFDFLMKSARNGGPLTRTSGSGAARLSSVRAVRRSLKWGNGRNPYSALQVSQETASVYGEEGG